MAAVDPISPAFYLAIFAAFASASLAAVLASFSPGYASFTTGWAALAAAASFAVGSGLAGASGNPPFGGP
jgi:hypothetical protein